MRRIIRPESGCALLLACLALAACSDEGTRQFGVRRDVQEQTRVTTPPPLSLPPILTERNLTPDVPSAPGTQAAALAGPAGGPAAGAPTGRPSAGEESLLDAAGPSVSGDIRQRVDQDAQIGRADPTFTNSLLSAPTSQQPMIQRGGKSWLDSIF